MNPDLHAALERYFHYPQFRPGQEVALQHVLQGHDALVVMPTGAGKSLIYQLSALLMDGTAIVFSPLIALMKDQVDGMNKRGIPATFINSSLSPDEQNQRQRGLVQGKYKLVLIAPERLRSPNFRAALASAPISMLVLDEAHCLSQWGHDFRPDYLNIAALRPQLQPKLTLALTATATPRTQNGIIEQLNMPEAKRFINGFNRSNLYFEVLPASSNTEKLSLIRDYLRERKNENASGIIYTGTRANAEEVAAFVRESCGMEAQHYHGAMDAQARAKVQDLFISGDLPIVVATNAFGMGIDRPDVRFVLHHTMPASLEAYYQEAGRAGRDGLPARATLIQSAQDIVLQEHFIKNDAPSSDDLRRIHGLLQVDMPPTETEIAQRLKLSETMARVAVGLLNNVKGKLDDGALAQIIRQVEQRREHKRSLLRTMIQYAQTDECRRAKILEYFGDEHTDDVVNPVCCDNCDEAAALKQPTEMRPAETRTERAALIVMDTISLLAQRNSGVGKGKLALILKGSQSEDVKYFTQNRNFGKFHELPTKEIESLIGQLLSFGYIKQAGDERPILQLSQRGELVLKARAAVNVRLRTSEASDGKSSPAVQRPRSEGNTIEVTRRMLDEGKSVEQIAAERQLTMGTVYSHCASLIAEGKLDIDKVIDTARQIVIRAAIKTVGHANALSPIKAILPDYVSYNEIRCVAEAWKRSNGQTSETTLATTPSTLDPLDAAALFERLRKWRIEQAKTESVPPYMVFSDQTLHAIVNAQPQGLDDLSAVRGIGPAKLERYGEDVLRVLANAPASA